MTVWSADVLTGPSTSPDHQGQPVLHQGWYLLATGGMRRGEALGLRWVDVDLDGGHASIRQTVITVKHRVAIGAPKTAKGRRVVALDAGTVAVLREPSAPAA